MELKAVPMMDVLALSSQVLEGLPNSINLGFSYCVLLCLSSFWKLHMMLLLIIALDSIFGC